MSKTEFICLFLNKSNNIVSYTVNKIEELANFPEVEYILRKDFVEYYGPQTRVEARYKYALVNKDGSNRDLVVGHFKLLDIGKDDGFFNHPYRTLLIQNLTDQSVNEYKINGPYSEFFLEKLLPLMDELNRCGSNEMYLQSLEVTRLRIYNKLYLDRISQLTKELNEMILK